MQRRSSTSTSTSTSNRRNHNRSHNNNFKFHNFIFNETNQKFCLEEQHGNKKITVLHWKSSNDDDKQQSTTIRQCDSDSKLINDKNQQQQQPSIKLDDKIRLNNNHHLQSSASFPLTIKNLNDNHVIEDNKQQQQQQIVSQFLPHHLVQFDENLTNNLTNRQYDDYSNANNCSSSVHNSFASSSTSSSGGGGRIHHDLQSLSSITTTTTTSAIATTPSSSSCSTNFNYSFNNLHLHNQKLSKRKMTLFNDDQDDDSNDDDDDDDFNIDSAVDSDDDDDDDDDLFYRTYRQKIQQRLECILQDQHAQQQQPLDLSVKKCLESDKSDDLNLCDNNNNQFTNTNNRYESLRKDASSPSTMISSIKCCSPSSHHHDHHLDYNKGFVNNPFMFDNNEKKPETTNLSTKRLLDDFDRKYDEIKSSSDIFDALLEEEIQKFLQMKSTTSSNNRLKTLRHSNEFINDNEDDDDNDIVDEFDRKFENKLKRLHFKHFAKNTTDNNNNNNRFNIQSNSQFIHNRSNINNHFKFDLDDGCSTSSFHHHNLTTNQSIFPSSSIMNTLPRSRNLNHRNQIRRHLEDAFKQNGFLVKTKQVSDANNSAMFCKFRQLRKYTRYYLKSWHNHLPDEVNKLWKGFLPPPKSDWPIYNNNTKYDDNQTSSSTISISDSLKRKNNILME